MEEDSLARAAVLLRERNAIDSELARLIQRPMTSGHLGEWIAAHVFDIELEPSAVAAGIDGRFRSGPLQGRTVNIKVVSQARRLAGYDRVRCARLLPGSNRATVSGSVVARLHSALVHRSRVPVRCAATPVRAGHARSEARCCLQRHQAAVDCCRDLPLVQQRPADRDFTASRAAQAIRSLTHQTPGQRQMST
jgi:hypothetical protein